MSDQKLKTLEQSLVDILNKTIDGVEKGTEFLMAELPDVISQLLLWHGVYNFILFLFGLFMIVALPYLGYFMAVKIIKTEEYYSEGDQLFVKSAGIICGGFFALFSLIPLNLTWLQIWVAPKVWLIEYAASLVK